MPPGFDGLPQQRGAVPRALRKSGSRPGSTGERGRGDEGDPWRDRRRARITLSYEKLKDIALTTLQEQGPFNSLNYLLTRFAEDSDKPLVILMDEIDSLVGDTLISMLRQLRSGYARRPSSFPSTIVLCGVRDVRDYRIHSDKDKTVITGGSAFNIKAESLHLGNFSRSEVEALYRQHTKETGQAFEVKALAKAWDLTAGQPWLVNALAYETCFRMPEDRYRSPMRSTVR